MQKDMAMNKLNPVSNRSIGHNMLDKRIMIMQCLGIIMVILGHSGDALPILSSWFPYYSFHMPLFIFISGYLYKKEQEDFLLEYIWKKFKHLIVPFYCWLVIYGLITNILISSNLISYGEKITLHNFWIYPWTYGCKYSFTAAWWFVPTLFLCQIVNIICRKLTKASKNMLREYLLLGVFLAMGIFMVEFSRKAGGMYGGKMNQFQMAVAKIGFLLPFFQIGNLFDLKFGDIIDKMKSYFIYPFIFCIQLVLLLLWGG